MIVASGITPGTPRPELGALDFVVGLWAKLSGERHAPELPLPPSAVRAYAERMGLGPAMVEMILHYDACTLSERDKRLRARMNEGKGNG